MPRDEFLSHLSDENVSQSQAGLYATLFLLAVLVLVPLTIFVLTRPVRLKPAAAPNAQLAISPTNNSATVGDKFNVFVTLDTKENFTDAVDVIVHYDSAKLKVYDTIKTDGLPYATVVGQQDSACGSPEAGARGKITFSGLAYDASLLPTPPPHNPVRTGGQMVTIATIPFEAIQPGQAVVKIFFTGAGVTTDSNVVETFTSQDLLAGAGSATYTIAAGSGTPSPTPTPCPSVTTPPTASPSPRQSPTPTLGDGRCNQPQYDLDCDGLICASDANILLANWRKTSPPYVCPIAKRPGCDPDFDNNNDVYGKEVSVLMSNWSGVDCDLRTTPTATSSPTVAPTATVSPTP